MTPLRLAIPRSEKTDRGHTSIVSYLEDEHLVLPHRVFAPSVRLRSRSMRLFPNGHFDGGHNPAKLPYNAGLLVRFERATAGSETHGRRLSELLLTMGFEQQVIVNGSWAILRVDVASYKG